MERGKIKKLVKSGSRRTTFEAKKTNRLGEERKGKAKRKRGDKVQGVPRSRRE